MTTIRSVMSMAPRTVAPTATIGDVLRLFASEPIRHLPVVADGRLEGIVSDRDVRAWRQALQDLRAGEGSRVAELALSRPIAQLMTRDVATVQADAPVGPVAAALAERRIGALVVVDDDHVTGIVSAVDLLPLLETTERSLRTVADLMTTAVYPVTPEDSLDAVLHVMLDHDVRHVPVVDGEGAVVGVVSHRDVLGRGTLRERVDEDGELGSRLLVLRDARADEVMSVAETTTPETPLHEAAAALRESGHGCLPVVDDRTLVGLLTESDFVRLAAGTAAA